VTQVLLFARARELAGTRRVELSGVTVEEVLGAAEARFGAGFGELCRTCTIVVDGETVLRSEFPTASAGSELAVLPPVSGGADDPASGSGDQHHSTAHDAGGPDDGIRVVVITVSDRAAAQQYEDLTGPAVEAVAEHRLGATVIGRGLVADVPARISELLISWCDSGKCDLVLTNGGTGLAPRDLTPEATRAVLDVEAPGLGELMRHAGLAHTPLAALSRQAAGRRGRSIVVNLPGSVKGATESLEALVEVLPHAVMMARTS